MIRQELRLDLRADAELTIHALMAPGFLQHLVIFDRDTGEISNQLHLPAMHVAPHQRPFGLKHVKTTPLPASRHHRGGEHPGRPQLTLNQPIQRQHKSVIRAEACRPARFVLAQRLE